MAAPKSAICLIVFQNREQKDLEGVVKECSETGYACIESGFIYDVQPPAKIKKVCAENNIRYIAGHGGYDTFKDEKKLIQTARAVKAAGADYIICSGVEGGGKTAADYAASAKIFNRAGKIATELGLTFCYHNHAFEFIPLENNVKGIYILSRETDSSLVKFNIDVSWVQIGRESPAEFILKNKDRAGYYHFKDAVIKGVADLSTEADLSKPFKMENITWTELGKGDIQLKEAYQAALEAGADYIAYEEDVSRIEVSQAIRDSREFLRGLGV